MGLIKPVGQAGMVSHKEIMTNTVNDKGNIIFYEKENKIYTALICNQKLQKIAVYPSIQAEKSEKETVEIGEIYIGKVTNVVQALHAAFVDVKKGVSCYLPLSETKELIKTNGSSGESTLKAGDEVLVQVYKEAIKQKQPMLTGKLSFSGKYFVVEQGNGISFSKKIKETQRKKLQEKLGFLFGDPKLSQCKIVVRTNALDVLEMDSAEPLKRELEKLLQEKDRIFRQAPFSPCYSLMSERFPAFLTMLKETSGSNIREYVTDNPFLFDTIQGYLKEQDTEALTKLRFYDDSLISLDKLYGMTGKLDEVLSKKVWLNSGGYLVIEHTEAMTVIDVNSGKNDKKLQQEVMIRSLNEEAAKEIFRQLRLRNISGMIMVDFVNFNTKEEQNDFLSYLDKLAKEEAVLTKVHDMTALGIVEITRKKVYKSLYEQIYC